MLHKNDRASYRIRTTSWFVALSTFDSLKWLWYNKQQHFTTTLTDQMGAFRTHVAKFSAATKFPGLSADTRQTLPTVLSIINLSHRHRPSEAL